VSDEIGTRLSRWSQRKLAARRGEAAEDAPRDDVKPAAPAAATPAAEVNPQAADETPVLPPIEDLTRDSDYTVFLAKNVPESIKNAALRKLWRSDPVFSVLDGLNDYCEDFNATYTPITMAQTGYKVGKGYFDEIAEKLEPAADDSPERVESTADAGASAGPIENRAPENDNNTVADEGETAAARRVGESGSRHNSSGQREDGA
jgi:Protein of unknown function (DUF3306)